MLSLAGNPVIWAFLSMMRMLRGLLASIFCFTAAETACLGQAVSPWLAPAPDRTRIGIHAQGFVWDKGIGCLTLRVQPPRLRIGVGVSVWRTKYLWWYTATSPVAGSSPPVAFSPCFYVSLNRWRRQSLDYQADFLLLPGGPQPAILLNHAFAVSFFLTQSLALRVGGMSLTPLAAGTGYEVGLVFVPVVGLGWEFRPIAYGKHLKMKPIKPCKP